MAFRYRQVNVQDGDIVDPDDWNENLRELTGEFNSYLDRDNIQEGSIRTRMINTEAFHSVYTDSTVTSFTLDGKSVQWAGGDATAADGVNFLEFEADVDGIITCEWSGTWAFNNDQMNEEADARPKKNQVASFRILVNGLTVAELYRSPDSRTNDSGYLVGAAPVGPGTVRVGVEVRMFKVDNKSGDIYSADNDFSVNRRSLLVIYRRR